jgi:two-component system LytT family sensor kinase
MRHDPFAKKDSLKGILITVAIILAAGSGFLLLGNIMELGVLFSLGDTILLAGGLWMICRTYVKFLWRRYPWEEYPVRHIVLEVAGIGMMTVIYGYLLYYTELKLDLIEPPEHFWPQAVMTLLITYLITGIHEMIYFYNQWIYHFSRSVRLERDNIQAKYETLKTQINPHFLFNSLNSLVNIVDENPAAVNYIQNLSELLRYMLGSRDRDLVYLRDELKVLNHYVALQKTRFRDNLQVSTEIAEKYHLYTLPPLALQMLVENCIKHNIISSEKPLKVSISAENEYIHVKNNLQRKEGVASTGQGLRNITERYRHFTGKEVKVYEAKNEFTVSLPLLVIEL